MGSVQWARVLSPVNTPVAVREGHYTGMFRGPLSAFTLLELVLAVAILAVVSTVTYLTFSTVTTAWKKGIVLTLNIIL